MTYHYCHGCSAATSGFISGKHHVSDAQTIDIADVHAAAVELSLVQRKDRRIRDVARDILALHAEATARTQIVARDVPREQSRCDQNGRRSALSVLDP